MHTIHNKILRSLWGGFILGMILLQVLPLNSPISTATNWNPLGANTSQTYLALISPTGCKITTGHEFLNNINATTRADNIAHGILSDSNHEFFGYEARIKVTYVFSSPIMAKSLQILASCLILCRDQPTGHKNRYEIDIQDAANHSVFETQITQANENLTFSNTVEVSSITLEAEHSWWFWDPYYTMELLVDAIIVQAVISNQAPIMAQSPVCNTSSVQLGQDVSVGQYAFTDGDCNDIITTHMEWERNRTNIISTIVDDTILTLDTLRFAKGDHVRAKVWAIDSFNQSSGSGYSNWVTVINSPPIIDSVQIYSNATNASQVFTSSLLTCMVTGSDLNTEQNLSYQYRWYKNGELTDHSEQNWILSPVEISSGMNITSQARIFDGETYSSFKTASVLVTNTPAQFDGPVSLSPATPLTSEPLTISFATPYDLDLDAISTTITFYRNRNTTFYEVIQTGSSTILDASFTEIDDSIYAEVVVDDLKTSMNQICRKVSPALRIENTETQIDNWSLQIWNQAKSAMVENSSITASCHLIAEAHLVDPDIQLLTASFLWYVDNYLVQNHSNVWVDPATKLCHDELTAPIVHGDQVYVIIQSRDSIALGQFIVSAVYNITNIAPRISHIGLSGAVSKTQPAQVEVSVEDLDSDLISLEYRWYIGGIWASDYNKASLPVTAFNRGDEIWVEVRASDSWNYSIWVASNAVIVANAIPVMLNVSIPTNIEGGSSIQVSALGMDFDPQDVIVYVTQWWENGHIVPNEFNPTLPASYVHRGDQIFCTVWAKDTQNAWSFGMNSSMIVIQNSKPIITTLQILAQDNTAEFCSMVLFPDDTLMVAFNATDQDQDSLQIVAIEWLVNNQVISNASMNTFHGSLSVYDQVAVRITISDGSANTTLEMYPVVIMKGSRSSLFQQISSDSWMFIFLGAIFVLSLISAVRSAHPRMDKVQKSLKRIPLHAVSRDLIQINAISPQYGKYQKMIQWVLGITGFVLGSLGYMAFSTSAMVLQWLPQDFNGVALFGVSITHGLVGLILSFIGLIIYRNHQPLSPRALKGLIFLVTLGLGLLVDDLVWAASGLPLIGYFR